MVATDHVLYFTYPYVAMLPASTGLHVDTSACFLVVLCIASVIFPVKYAMDVRSVYMLWLGVRRSVCL